MLILVQLISGASSSSSLSCHRSSEQANGERDVHEDGPLEAHAALALTNSPMTPSGEEGVGVGQSIQASG
jgi:hypothetical protein